jgi:hypothetical protein
MGLISWGHKERDTLQAFLDARRGMISAYAPELSGALVERLARATRGLRKGDIERCLDEFRLTGSVSYRADHPTNTCDPYTGNWCEHLMPFAWLERTIANAGFSVAIMPGRYSTAGPPLKRGVKTLLNAAIRLLGRRGMVMAPYFIVYALTGPRREPKTLSEIQGAHIPQTAIP